MQTATAEPRVWSYDSESWVVARTAEEAAAAFNELCGGDSAASDWEPLTADQFAKSTFYQGSLDGTDCTFLERFQREQAAGESCPRFFASSDY